MAQRFIADIRYSSHREKHRFVQRSPNCFTVVAELGAAHERTVAGSGAAIVKLPQFKAVNTLLSNLKTALSGTYHTFDFAKYAHRYLAEFQWRFNRRFDLLRILGRLVTAGVQTPPQPRRTIRLAEVGSCGRAACCGDRRAAGCQARCPHD